MSEQLITEMTGIQVRDYLDAGKASVSDFYGRLLSYVQEGDQAIHAFVNFDPKVANLRAESLEHERALGRPVGEIFGMPIGIKDIIDTVDFPTEFGSVIHEGRYAISNATLVQRLKEAGAIIVGKTSTTEFASMFPTATCNPHNLACTPGGSSSGSAAAVAAGFVPVAIGSQTNGSVIRPASFCGVYGYKPSSGVIPRSGVLEQSPSLDQIGLFARSLEDIALVTEIMSGDDGFDEATKGRAPIRLLRVCQSEPPVQPKFCFFKTPWWAKVEPEAQEAYLAMLEHLGPQVATSLEMPLVVENAVQWQKTVHMAELAFSMQKEFRNHPDQLSDMIKAQIEYGMSISVMDYMAAKERMAHVNNAFDEYFEHFDAILTPAALGGAPKGLSSTGDPIMQTIWTFAGLPALNLPLLKLSNGLPLGVQAIGSYQNDGRLLRSARWLVHQFSSQELPT